MSEEQPIYYKNPASIPEIEEVLASPYVSYWLKMALQTALTRDPVDCFNDAAQLFDLLKIRADAALLRGSN